MTSRSSEASLFPKAILKLVRSFAVYIPKHITAQRTMAQVGMPWMATRENTRANPARLSVADEELLEVAHQEEL